MEMNFPQSVSIEISPKKKAQQRRSILKSNLQHCSVQSESAPQTQQTILTEFIKQINKFHFEINKQQTKLGKLQAESEKLQILGRISQEKINKILSLESQIEESTNKLEFEEQKLQNQKALKFQAEEHQYFQARNAQLSKQSSFDLVKLKRKASAIKKYKERLIVLENREKQVEVALKIMRTELRQNIEHSKNIEKVFKTKKIDQVHEKIEPIQLKNQSTKNILHWVMTELASKGTFLSQLKSQLKVIKSNKLAQDFKVERNLVLERYTTQEDKEKFLKIEEIEKNNQKMRVQILEKQEKICLFKMNLVQIEKNLQKIYKVYVQPKTIKSSKTVSKKKLQLTQNKYMKSFRSTTILQLGLEQQKNQPIQSIKNTQRNGSATTKNLASNADQLSFSIALQNQAHQNHSLKINPSTFKNLQNQKSSSNASHQRVPSLNSSSQFFILSDRGWNVALTCSNIVNTINLLQAKVRIKRSQTDLSKNQLGFFDKSEESLGTYKYAIAQAAHLKIQIEERQKTNQSSPSKSPMNNTQDLMNDNSPDVVRKRSSMVFSTFCSGKSFSMSKGGLWTPQVNNCMHFSPRGLLNSPLVDEFIERQSESVKFLGSLDRRTQRAKVSQANTLKRQVLDRENKREKEQRDWMSHVTKQIKFTVQKQRQLRLINLKQRQMMKMRTLSPSKRNQSILYSKQQALALTKQIQYNLQSQRRSSCISIFNKKDQEKNKKKLKDKIRGVQQFPSKAWTQQEAEQVYQVEAIYTNLRSKQCIMEKQKFFPNIEVENSNSKSYSNMMPGYFGGKRRKSQTLRNSCFELKLPLQSTEIKENKNAKKISSSMKPEPLKKIKTGTINQTKVKAKLAPNKQPILIKQSKSQFPKNLQQLVLKQQKSSVTVDPKLLKYSQSKSRGLKSKANLSDSPLMYGSEHSRIECDKDQEEEEDEEDEDEDECKEDDGRFNLKIIGLENSSSNRSTPHNYIHTQSQRKEIRVEDHNQNRNSELSPQISKDNVISRKNSQNISNAGSLCKTGSTAVSFLIEKAKRDLNSLFKERIKKKMNKKKKSVATIKKPLKSTKKRNFLEEDISKMDDFQDMFKSL